MNRDRLYKTDTTHPTVYNARWSINYGISVIIPTRKRIDLLRSCIESLFNKSHNDILFEIILIIDNDDTDSLTAAVDLQNQYKSRLSQDNTEYCPITILITTRSSCMQRDYNNAGAIAAKGDLIFVLNDDAVIDTQNWNKLIYDYYIANRPIDDIMLISILDDTHNGSYIDSRNKIMTRETHGACFPVVTKTFVNIVKGVFPSVIRMWGADSTLHKIFTTLERVFELDTVFVNHNSYHSHQREKDDINLHVHNISEKYQNLQLPGAYVPRHLMEYIDANKKK